MSITNPADQSPTPRPVRIAVVTVSDTRTPETDTSGDLLVERLQAAGHELVRRALIKDERARLEALITAWCGRGAEPVEGIEAIIITGGTGITGRDVTVDVLETLYDKSIPGFGELFRMLSYSDIGASTIQSRASGGTIGDRVVFALPGSPNACRLGWDSILRHQLDVRSKPCNLVKLLPRLSET